MIVVLFDRGGREKDTTKSMPLWPAAAVFGWLGIYKRRVVNTSYYAGEKLFIFFTFVVLRSLHTPMCLITYSRMIIRDISLANQKALELRGNQAF